MAGQPLYSSLSNPFQAQEEQARLSALLSDAQNRQLLQMYSPAAVGAQARGYAALAPDPPKLQFGIDNSDPSQALSLGIGNGINNYFAMRNYRQQQSLYNDLAGQYKQAELARQKQVADLAENARQKQLSGTTLTSTLLDPAATTEARRNALINYSRYDGGETAKELAKIGREASTAPLVGTGEGQKDLAKAEAKIAGAQAHPLYSAQGVPQAAGIDARRTILGFDPTTTTDLNQKEATLRSTQIANATNEGKLAEQPREFQRQEANFQLDLVKKQVDNEIAVIRKRFEPILQQQALDRGELGNQKDKDSLERARNGQILVNSLMDSGELYTTDPKKQAHFQAVFAAYGLDNPYKGMPTGYDTLLQKDGNALILDKSTGLVHSVDSKGKLGKPFRIGGLPAPAVKSGYTPVRYGQVLPSKGITRGN